MEIISEIGLAHNGNLNLAVDMIRISKECGATTAKFQFYYTDILCTDRNCFDSYKLLDKIKMRSSWLPILFDECKQREIEFLVTAFDRYSAEAVEPYVKRFKVASPEVANIKYLEFLSVFNKPIILSTGKVTDEQLDRIFDKIKADISLLYCKSLYPSKPSDYNLNEIDRLRKRYGCKVGLSCHCVGIKNAIDAVKQHGAEIVEKHFTLTNDTVDSAVSIYPDDLKKLTEIIRRNNG